MGKSLLTTQQKELLGIISKDKYLTKVFFFTGGTALSEFYFQHRFSEDLDFFSEREFDPKQLLISIATLSHNPNIKKVEQQNLSGQNTFYFFYDNDKSVKVDFAFFPFTPLGKFKKFNSLNVSSLEDITINKIHAITNRKRARDYLDLYFSLRKLEWTIKDIQKNYRLKFDLVLASDQLATAFTNILDAEDFPLFLGTTSWDTVRTFFLKETDKIKRDILK